MVARVTTLEYKALFLAFFSCTQRIMWWICQHEPVKNAQKYLFSDFIFENYGICWEIFIQNNRTWISWTLLNVQNHLQSHHLSWIYHISPYFIMIISWASNKNQFSLQTSLQITKWVNGDGKKGVEKMSNSPLKVMIFERPSKGTDRVHPDEMQWEWLAEMEWKDWNMAYFNLFHAPNPGFLRNAKRYFGRSLSDPKRPGWFGNQSRKMPLTQEFTQKWVGPSQFFHKAYTIPASSKGCWEECWLNEPHMSTISKFLERFRYTPEN